jgi:hypothetical protein
MTFHIERPPASPTTSLADSPTGLEACRKLCRCRVRLRALYLALGLKPIVQIVTVSPSALLVKFAESAAQSGSGRSARPTSVRVLMAFSRSRLVGDPPFFPVVQSAALICRLWCVSLPYLKLDTNPTPKRGSTALPETGVSGATRVSNRSQRRDFGPADRRAARRGRHRHTRGRAPCPAC